MGMQRIPSAHPAVMVVVAAFSQQDAVLDWAIERIEEAYGPLFLASERFAFDQTDFYAASMGRGLKKVLVALDRLVDPTGLPDWKLAALKWERECAGLFPGDVVRPLNLDPGYVTPGKLVLASTKDHAHRLYLDHGIYAETTLYFEQGAWRAREWTFPDYREGSYHPFLSRCREELLRRQRRARNES